MKLIKINAIWCPACLIMSSRVNKVADKYNIEIINYDYDNEKEEINKYNVGNILPELILLDENGNEIKRLIGEHSIKDLEKFLGE